MQHLATVQCIVCADADVVLWNSTFLHFIQHVHFYPGLFQCVYAYVCISVSLSFISPSLWKSLRVFLFVLFAFNFSFDLSFLLKPLNFPSLFPTSWILLPTLSSPSTWRKINCHISDKQCDNIQLRKLLHFKFLPCRIE